MTVVEGQRDTGNVLAAQRVIDMHREILLLEPDAAPLTVVLKQIYEGGRRIAARDPKFSWLEDELDSRFLNVNGSQTDSDTTIETDDSSFCPDEVIVKNTRTGELLYVSSAGATNLTVVRGISGSTAAAMNDNDDLYILAVAAKEGDVSQVARSQNPSQKDNYTQVFKKSVQASGSWLSSSNITSTHDWDHQRKKTAIEHLKDIELALIFSSPSADAATTGIVRTTGGILNFATANNQDAGGTLTEVEFETFLRTVTRYGGRKKVLLASPLLVSVLNTFSSGKLVTSVGDETYGVKVMNMVSAHGEVTLVKHNLLEGDVYGGYGIALDLAFGNVAYRYLAGDGPGGARDTKLLVNRQANDLDGRKDEWLTECGLQFGLAKAHGVLTGVTG